MAQWQKIEEEGRFDKLLWGFGGPVLSDARVKIQRMPFINPEMLASPAHTIPYDVLQAIDEWTWNKVCRAKRVLLSCGRDLAARYEHDHRALLFIFQAAIPQVRRHADDLELALLVRIGEP